MSLNGAADDAGLVLIIGAGCTGLALAHGLKKAGIPCKVFERKKSLSDGERDWNMGLHWGAPVLQSLIQPEKWALLQTWQVDPKVPTKDVDFLQFLNGQTGESIAKIPVNHFYRIRRTRLRECLVQDIDIQFGKQLVRISFAALPESGVTAHFSDGSTRSGMLLVGADGAKSKARQLLLGAERSSLQRLSYAATFLQSKYSRDKALFFREFHPLYIATVHPQGPFAWFGLQEADNPDPETWIFYNYFSWPCTLEQQDEISAWTDTQILDHAKGLAKDFSEPWKSAYECLPDDPTVWHLGMTSWDPSEADHCWDNHEGRVTLVGDAAHPMSFQRGQGLNHSLADAAKLRDVLVGQKSKASVPGGQGAAIADYEEEMKARSGEEVRISLKQTIMMHDWDELRNSPTFRIGLAQTK